MTAIRLQDPILNALDHLADTNSMTRTDLIRIAIEQLLIANGYEITTVNSNSNSINNAKEPHHEETETPDPTRCARG